MAGRARIAGRAMAAVALAMVLGCSANGPVGGVPYVPPPPSTPGPSITSFAAVPSTIQAGGTALLTGVFSNGAGVITPGNLPASSGVAVGVNPAVTTTYTLTVTSSTGQSVKFLTTVTVGTSSSSSLALFAGMPTVPGSANGQGSAAAFNTPGGLAVDASGNVYVADTLNGTLRKITPAGLVSTLAGTAGNLGSTNGLGGAASFYNPSGVALDASGNLYVADTTNDLIRKVTPAGSVTTLAGAPGQAGSTNGAGSAARFNLPQAVAVDASGNIYVADTYNSLIRKVDPGGGVTTLAGIAGQQGGLDGPGASATFNLPAGIAVDGSGNVYVADTGNATLRRISPSGQVSTLAGTPGVVGALDGTGPAASFSNPQGLCLDAAGNLYVADSTNTLIRKVTPAGVVTTVVGTPGSMLGDVPGPLPGSLAYPTAVAVDPASGALFVTDGNAVMKVTF